MGVTDTRGTRPAATARRRHGVLPGQAYIFIALAMPVLCGMLALAVDVGTTTARYQALQHAAENAAEAGAYALYGSRIGATSSLTDTGVWNAMASKLTAQGLRVMNAPGGSVPSDPCVAGYLTNQVAMRATYLDATASIITSTNNTPWVVGSGSIPLLAWGVSVTLGGCQPAGFGGVLGHPTYTMWVDGSAGRWLPGPLYSPTPDNSGSAPFIPYAATGAPYGACSGTTYLPTLPPNGTSPDRNDPVQVYCKDLYTLGDSVTLYANGRGQGNDWGSDASFKGYIGGASTIGTENWVPAGHGNNAPSCPLPSQVTVPIISGVNHTGNTENFVILETIVVNITQCGNPTTGTIVSVYDPYGYGVVATSATPTPGTPMPTATPPTISGGPPPVIVPTADPTP
jgi:Flp pilus assembly protein TadG